MAAESFRTEAPCGHPDRAHRNRLRNLDEGLGKLTSLLGLTMKEVEEVNVEGDNVKVGFRRIGQSFSLTRIWRLTTGFKLIFNPSKPLSLTETLSSDIWNSPQSSKSLV